MGNNNRRTGTVYERAAGEYLRERGYQILEYNYRCRQGEIDIIAKEDEYLVFCEVKYRSDSKKGSPEDAVDRKKQKKISRCALYYMAKKGVPDMACRFDVVCVEKDRTTLYRNAFDYIE